MEALCVILVVCLLQIGVEAVDSEEIVGKSAAYTVQYNAIII